MSSETKQEYADWIRKHVLNPSGTCREATLDMQEAFPHLIRIRGHYICPIEGERPHWWLEDADGSIVDPTAHQFPSNGTGQYSPWDESQPEPTGRCLNCAELVYSHEPFCNTLCRQAVLASMGMG